LTRLLKELLRGIVTPEQLAGVESGIDVVGDIAILRLTEPIKRLAPRVGEAVLVALKNVKVVLDQEGPIEGEYRLRKLIHIAGERRTTTVHRENNCAFSLDVATCYFSPRLSTERLRVAGVARDGEKILNMFAGVGPFSIVIARRREVDVCSNELNRAAYEYHLQNNRLNKVASRIETLNLDAAELPSRLGRKFDRILMPHPSGSLDYLHAAVELLKEGGTIHCYSHVSATNPEEGASLLRSRIDSTVEEEHKATVRKVREVGPRLLEMVAEIRVR
jgi:tRNA (guanine37-N1)-methyltransferase